MPVARAAFAVREATRADWPAIWPFMREIVVAGETIAYDPAMTEAAARAGWLAGPPARTTVAVTAGGLVVGTAHTHTNRPGPGSHVASATFMVSPAHQGRGAGRALVLDSLDWATRSGYSAMQFNAVVASNRPALSLYESLGFEIVGTVPEAFRHPALGHVDLHVMHKRLGHD